MAELGVGYISIVAVTEGMKRDINKAFGQAASGASSHGKKAGDMFSGAMSKALKVGAAAAGAAAGGVAATAVAKGLGRLSSIETAQAKLKGLGNDAQDVEKIMDNALASVKGTSYGLGEAATTAAGAVAAGIEPGAELEGVLKSVANSAAAAGIGMDEMGSIFNKVASQGAAKNDVLMQVADRGIPIYEALAEQMGVTAAEVQKLASEGAVDFELFSQAMAKAGGTVADELGTTTKGTIDNLGASLGRLGETVMGPMFQNMPLVVGSLTSAFDSVNDALKPFSERISASMGPAMERLAETIETRLAPWLGTVAEKFGEVAASTIDAAVDPDLWERIGNIFGSVSDTVSQLWPSIESLVASFARASGAVSVAVWESLSSVLEALAPLIESVLVPMIEKIADLAEQNPEAIQAVVMALIGFKAVNAVTGPITMFSKNIVDTTSAVSTLGKTIKKGGVAQGLKDIGKMGGDANPVLSKMGKSVGGLGGIFSKLGVVFKPVLSFAGTFLRIALNAVKMINPWVAVISALVAALTWFFTQTEMGQEIWQNFMDILATGWEWLKDVFVGVWEDHIQPVLQSLWDMIQGVWENVIQPVFAKIGEIAQLIFAGVFAVVVGSALAAWNLLSAAIEFAWNSIIEPAIGAFGALMTWLWENAVKPAIHGIVVAWEWLRDAVVAVWNWINDSVIQPFVNAMNWLWHNAVQPAIDAIVAAWEWLRDILIQVWNVIRDAVFTAFETYINILRTAWDFVTQALAAAWEWVSGIFQSVWQTIRDVVFAAFERVINVLQGVFEKVTDAMGAAWQWLGDQLGKVWNWIDQYVFGALRTGLDFVQNAFQNAVDAIGRIWDGLKRAAAVPVKFVIDTVWNKGILAAWNSIAGFLPGVDEKDPISHDLGGFHTGGVTPGYTPGRDVHDFYSPTGGVIHLSGGEAIMRPEWTRAVGGKKAVDRMNSLARSGRLSEDQMAIGLEHGSLGAFANGGVIHGSITSAVQRAMANIVHAKYPSIILTSGTRGGGGMHGAGLATDWATPGAFGNSQQQLSLAHDIARTYPGSAELIYDSPGWSGNIKNGRNVGPFGSFYTMAQAGAHHDHVHWGMTSAPNIQFGGGVFEGGNNGGDGGLFGGFFNWVADQAKGIWEKFVSPIKGKIDEKRDDSAFWDIPFGFFEEVKNKAWSFLSSLFGSGGGQDHGAVDTSDISGPVVEQVEQVFARHGFTGAEWEAAKWIIQKESSWNPTITNPSSGAYGLFQFNPMGGNTLAGYLPDRNPNPAVQADAGARYMKDRYGTPTAAKAFWEQNGWYSSGGVLPKLGIYDTGGVLEHGGTALNLSGKPEVVINNDQLRAINKLANNVGVLVRKLPEDGNVAGFQAALHDEFAEFIKPIHKDLARIADKDSIPGITARQTVRRVLDLGIDIPGAELITGILDAEETLWASRDRAAGHAANVREKEEALAAARSKAAEAHKVEVAEGENAEEKRAEAVRAANNEIAEAEKALAQARRSQAMDLDNIQIISPEMIQGVTNVLKSAADGLVQLGLPAAAVGAGLAHATGGMSAFAALIGPAGITLGMVLDAAKVLIGLAKTVVALIKRIVDWVKKFIEKIREAQRAAREALSEGLAVIADYYKLLTDMGHEYAELQQKMIRNYVAMREAEFALRVAQNDRMIAAVESELKVAEARLELDREIAKGARTSQLHLQGLHEDWDSYMTHQARVAQNALGRWSDSAISALFTYEQARAQAVHTELSARRDQITAEAKLAELTRENARNQFDLIQLQERAARMMAKANGVDVDLPGATAAAQASKIMSEMAELQRKMNKNVLGRVGAFFGARGSFGNEFRGQKAQMDALQHALGEVLKESNISLEGRDFRRMMRQLSYTAYRGGDPSAALRAFFPELAAADKTLRASQALRPVYDAQDEKKRMERQLEDLGHEVDLFGKTQPLAEALKGLDYTIKSLEHSAKAFESDNEGVRGEYLDAARAAHEAAKKFGVEWQHDRRYWSDQVKDQVRKEVTIYMDGDRSYTADEVERLVRETLDGSNVRANIRSSRVAAARRAGV